MATLMIYNGTAPGDARVSRTGGIPLVPAGFIWPNCAECDGPMQFIAQLFPEDLPTLDSALLIFMCQNAPGMCDDWDATSGGNKAYLISAGDLVPASVPAEGETQLGAVSTMRFITSDAAADDPVLIQGIADKDGLGLIDDEPEWIQSDETPDCPKCQQRMTFVLQLEEGRDYRAAINFGGGGAGYAFVCHDCQEAAFCWQCT